MKHQKLFFIVLITSFCGLCCIKKSSISLKPLHNIFHINNRPIVWSKSDIPITCTHDSTVTVKYLNAYESARKFYNRIIGKSIFKKCTSLMKCHMSNCASNRINLTVFPHYLEKLSDGRKAVGAVIHSRDLKTKNSQHILTSAVVVISSKIENSLILKLMKHELGHVLGLKHHSNNLGIMYPTMQRHPMKLMNHEINSLRHLYGKR